MARLGAAGVLASLCVVKAKVVPTQRLRAFAAKDANSSEWGTADGSVQLHSASSDESDELQSLRRDMEALKEREGAQETKNAALEAELKDLRAQFSAFKEARSHGVGTAHAAASAAASSSSSKQPCQCVATDPAWVAPTRTTPKCIFIDLGAANGNTFQKFLSDGYGPVSNCPSGDYEAWLVEANPRFKGDLESVQSQYKGRVHSLSSTAAYDCEAETSFYLDSANVETNYWGSSMSEKHPDVQKSGLQKVTVPTINLNRMIYEHTIPGDFVLVKIDIEGSEWDVVPCLSSSPAARLVDRILLEEHPIDWQLGSTTREGMDAALAALRAGGVDIPKYFSETL